MREKEKDQFCATTIDNGRPAVCTVLYHLIPHCTLSHCMYTRLVLNWTNTISAAAGVALVVCLVCVCVSAVALIAAEHHYYCTVCLSVNVVLAVSRQWSLIWPLSTHTHTHTACVCGNHQLVTGLSICPSLSLSHYLGGEKNEFVCSSRLWFGWLRSSRNLSLSMGLCLCPPFKVWLNWPVFFLSPVPQTNYSVSVSIISLLAVFRLKCCQNQ